MSLGLAVIACGLAAGTCHPIADPRARSVAVRVTAPHPATVRLDALDVPRGWIAAFCTPRVCSPFRATLFVRGSGSLQISFVPAADAPAPLRFVRLRATGAAGRADLLCHLEGTIACADPPPSSPS